MSIRVAGTTATSVDAYSYDPFGARSVTANGYPQPFGYLGAYTNPATGLVHLGARYYDPILGRFTQPDPQIYPADINQASPYPYAGNDPINNTDETGTSGVDAAGGRGRARPDPHRWS